MRSQIKSEIQDCIPHSAALLDKETAHETAAASFEDRISVQAITRALQPPSRQHPLINSHSLASCPLKVMLVTSCLVATMASDMTPDSRQSWADLMDETQTDEQERELSENEAEEV